MKVIFCLLALGTAVNPVSRVVKLLEKLQKDVESDGKAEDAQFAHFQCWCRKVKEAKAQYEATATVKRDSDQEELDNLTGRTKEEGEESYADKTDSEHDMTSERAELAAEGKRLQQSLTELRADRTEAVAQYEKTMKFLTESIDALKSAQTTLSAGTTKRHQTPKTETLVSMSVSLNRVLLTVGSEMSAHEKRELNHFADVPKQDWKKLNRDAGFQQKYKHRSGKIQKIVADMLQNMTKQRKDTRIAEQGEDGKGGAKKEFEDLESAKEGEIDKNDEASANLAGEKAVREARIKELEAAIKLANDNMATDKIILAETAATCAERTQTFEERLQGRSQEKIALAKAIEILTGDDARDAFSSSYKSQGQGDPETRAATLLQTGKSSAIARRLQSTISVLKSTVRLTHSNRVNSIAILLQASKPGPVLFKETPTGKEVIGKIQQMLLDLETEYSDDLADKEQCEETGTARAEDAKEAAKNIDDANQNVDDLNAENAQLQVEIEAHNTKKAELQDELKAATVERAEENTRFIQSISEDEAAKGFVNQAYNVLKNEFGGALMQMGVDSEDPQFDPSATIAGGEAPPPPPMTQQGGYVGADEAGQSIISMISIIAADIQKDMVIARKEEQESVDAFGKFTMDTTTAINAEFKAAKDKGIAQALNGVKKGTELSTVKNQKKSLKSATDAYASFRKDCDYIAIHFQTRKSNREAESSGLQKALAILQGAAFDAPDPDRAMEVGDAFVQKSFLQIH